MTKSDEVFKALQEGWKSIDDLHNLTFWQPHTIRAAISVGAKKRNLKVERVRAGGVTSYRVPT